VAKCPPKLVNSKERATANLRRLGSRDDILGSLRSMNAMDMVQTNTNEREKRERDDGLIFIHSFISWSQSVDLYERYIP
jgi:hypothetical protein